MAQSSLRQLPKRFQTTLILITLQSTALIWVIRGTPNFGFSGENGIPSREGGREGGRGSFAIITFGQNIICHKGRVRLPKQMNFRRRSQGGGGYIFNPNPITLFLINFYIITLYFYIKSGKTKFLEKK